MPRRIRPLPSAARQIQGLACAVAVLATVFGVVLWRGRGHPAPAATSSSCSHRLAESGRMSAPFDFGPRRVDVLGDSYSVGADLSRPRTQTWDVLLARQARWRLRIRGIGGTGFVNPGSCGNGSYQARVAQVLSDRPNLVIVEGGLNDVGRPGVEAAAARLLRSFPSTLEVIVVGPPAAPAREPGLNRAVDRALRSAVGRAAHRRYISTIGWRLSFLPSGIHLTVDGHRTFAAKLAKAIGS